MWPFSPTNSSTIQLKQEERRAALKSARTQVLANIEDYLSADASTIVSNISTQKWTASQVLEAYITRSAQVHEATNCLTEIIYDTARVRAKELDAEFERTGKIVGPLHGVPMSFKDMFAIKDYDATVGFSQWSYKPCPKSADAAEMLMTAGVIPFVKTNIPQTMLAFECANPLWGRTLNPYSPDYTCGGSSGGEGALLAASGSALGFGSDIGGSLRIPAGMCGVYSLKPSIGRISSNGAMSSNPGFSFITAVVGPLGRSVSDLRIACQILFGQQDSEGQGSVAPVPFRETDLPKSLKFGYYTDDGFVKASPANERAVLESVQALRRAGHDCIDLTSKWPFGSQPVHIMSSYFSADSYKALLEPVGSDPKDPSLFLAIYPPRLPRFLRTILGWVADALGDGQFANLLRDARPKGIGEMYDLNLVKKDLTKRLHEEIWETHGLDGIICPVGALPSIPHGSSRDLSPIANATMVYNLIDSPVGVLPVTRVDPSKDMLTTTEWPQGERGGSWLVGSKCKANYDPVKMKGLPVGVQIAGRKWEDEKVLAIMDVVDQALGERGFGPSGGARLKLY